MKNRMSRCAALIGTVLSLSGFAQVCQEVSLYSNGESGKMDQSGMTFPEAPEWNANWGEMDGLTPPYIRWSGMKNYKGNWTGNLSLSNLPAIVQGGDLTFKVRATQKVRFGLWLESEYGRSAVKYYELEANRSYALKVRVAELIGKEKATVQKVGVGIFGVPANQYTTLFLDDVTLGCVATENATVPAVGSDSIEYVFSEITPKNPLRPGKFIETSIPMTSAAYTDAERSAVSDSTTALFVLSEQEHLQIVRSMGEGHDSTHKSPGLWFRNLYFIERNRLRDSVIANPKSLFYEARSFAAATDNRAMPLLIGNVDYAYRECVDTACISRRFLKARLLLAGLPSAIVHGSLLKLYYDPYFVCTNRNILPTMEIQVSGKWLRLAPGGELQLEFESAGIHQVLVRLNEGGVTVNQNLFVEVK